MLYILHDKSGFSLKEILKNMVQHSCDRGTWDIEESPEEGSDLDVG